MRKCGGGVWNRREVILVDVNTAEALVVIFIVVSLAVIGGWFLFFSDKRDE